jgi:hypothetical protein
MSMMTNFLKMIALNGSAAERAELKAMLEGAADTAVAVRPARKGKGKRTLSPEQKAKMAEGRRRAAAERAGAPAAVPVSKPAKAKRPAWKVEKRVSQKGVPGKTIMVGPFTAWLADGDTEKRAAIMDAINHVFRAACIEDVVAQF